MNDLPKYTFGDKHCPLRFNILPHYCIERECHAFKIKTEGGMFAYPFCTLLNKKNGPMKYWKTYVRHALPCLALDEKNGKLTKDNEILLKELLKVDKNKDWIDTSKSNE